MSDLRVRRGLERQLELRRELIQGGLAPLGWKAGFGAPASLERFGLDGPLIGFLTDASVVADGAEVEIQDWSRAVAEPELAVYLAADLAPGIGAEGTHAAIASIGPAIELADIDRPPDDVEEALAGNIFHKAVILGRPDSGRSGGDLGGLEAIVSRGDEQIARTDRLEELTGKVVEILAHLAAHLAEHNERMRAGDVVICGSIVPPIDVLPGDVVHFELKPMQPISVRLS